MIGTLLNLLTQIRGVAPADYCHLETSAGKDNDGEHYPYLLMSTGGYISGIDIGGMVSIVGAEESALAHEAITSVFEMVLMSGGHIDWGYSQNPLESEHLMRNFYKPMRSTAKVIGIDVDRQLDSSEKHLAKWVRPEHSVMYIITNPGDLGKDQIGKLKKMGAEFKNAFDEIKPGQGLLPLLTQTDELRMRHNTVVEAAIRRLKHSGFIAQRMGARQIPWAIRRDASYETPAKWEPWLWGDPASFRTTPEDKAGVSSIMNWGGLSLGMQIHENAIVPTDIPGISRVGKYYVAPLLVEMLPSSEKWVTELLTYIPKDVPFRYRAYTKPNQTSMQQLASVLARVTNFSKKYLRSPYDISESFDYVDALVNARLPQGNVAISMATWHTDKNKLIENLETIKTALNQWGRTQVLQERGDAMEAVIATIPGYSTTLFTASTLERLGNVTKLVPHTRPGAPFKNGLTPLRTEDGKLFSLSTRTPELAAFIETVVAPSGSGKTVYQLGVARDSILRPGVKELKRHCVIDIGPGGLGTVKALRASLPANKAHDAVFETLSTSIRHAFNPFDLQLGAKGPTALDFAFLCDFVTLLATPQGQPAARPLMYELVREVIQAAYDKALDPDTANIYEPGLSIEVDKVLTKYPAPEGGWGMRKTWIKVRDYLFDLGYVRQAIVAQRYVVPMVPELPSVMAQNASISQRYGGKAGEGMSLTDEFTTLISGAAKQYPLLTQPTRVDFDSARYVIMDLNEVTQDQRSQQTGVMYALAAQMGTRDYWLSKDDLINFGDRYAPYMEAKIREIRSSDLGVTFEEFRRTAHQPRLRSMINRWMAEGRKWGMFVQVVGQQPDHFDAEMFGHATIHTFMGRWNGQMMKQLEKMGVELSITEKFALQKKVKGPGPEGSSMLIRYNLKDYGWGSQLVYMTKSPVELWSLTSTPEDTRMRFDIEEMVQDMNLANDILVTAFPKGSVQELVETKQKDAAEMGVPIDNVYGDLAERAVKTWRLLKQPVELSKVG